MAWSMATLRPLYDFEAVIYALGGTSALARMCELQAPAAVCNWRQRNGQFPCRYYWVIKRALADHGYVPARELFTFHAVRKRAA
jgi:hypothetical protein